MANILIINRIEEGLFTHTLTADGEMQTAIDNAPNLTSFWINGVRVMDFKTKNGSPLVRNQRILPSEITITDSFGSTPPQTGFTNDVQVWNALGALGYFQGFSGGSGGGGVDSFINLTDINPNLYLGFEGMVYVVNETATGLEPVIFYNYNNLTQLDDVEIDSLVPSDTGKYVAVSMVDGQPKFTLVTLPNSGNDLPNGFTNLGTQSLVDGEYTATIGYEWNYQNIHYALVDDFTTTINPAGEGNSRIDVIHTVPGTNEFTKTEGTVSAGQNTAVKPVIPVGALEVTILSIYEDTISEPTDPITGTQFITKSSYGWTQSNISGENATIIYQSDANAFELINPALVSIDSVSVSIEDSYNGQQVWILNKTGNSIILNNNASGGLATFLPFIFPEGQDMTIANNGLVRFKRKDNEMLFESYSIGGAGDYIPRSGTVEGQPITGALKSELAIGFAFDALASIKTQGFSYADTFQGKRFKIGGGTDSPEITAYASEEAFKTNARIDGTEYFDKTGNPNAHAQMQDIIDNNDFFNSNNIPSHLSLEKSILNSGTWDANIREIGNVIKLQDGRLFLTYTGTTLPYTEGASEFIGGATSSDNGVTWTKIGSAGKIINTNSEDPFVVVNPSNGLLHMYVEKKVSSFPGFHAGIELFTANISDLNTWTSQGLVLEKTSAVWENKDVSSPTLIIKDNVWHLFYEGRGTNSQEGVIALATSADGITFTRNSNSPLIYGSQYNNTSPTSGWFTHCVPDDVKLIRNDFYLTAHCYNGFTFAEGVFRSSDGINWKDCLNTWVTRSDNDENLGNGLMFYEDNKFLYNSNTQLLIGNLISNPYKKFIHSTRSSATGISNIKSGNVNEVITLSITAESNMEFSKGFSDNSGVVKIINNPTNFLAAFTVEGSGKINNEDAFFLPAGESAVFYGVGLNMWNAFKVRDNNVLHKTGYAIETKTGNLNINGSFSTNTESPRGRFDIRGASDVVAFIESLTAGYGSLFFQSANGGSFFGSLNDTPLVIHSGGIPAISIDPTSRIATFLQPANFSSDIEVTDFNKGVILRSPNGERWRINISNTGVLTTTSI